MIRAVAILLLMSPAFAAAESPRAVWQPGRLSVPVVIDGTPVPYSESAIFVMPGQTFRVGFGEGSGGGAISFGGQPAASGQTIFTAPAVPGLTKLEIRHPASGERAVINVFTLVPASRTDGDGFLNGYRMGRYPERPLRGLSIYEPPAGYVEVTADNADTPVSPNFRLGQFVCKQSQGYPKYVAMRADLPAKLEQILATLNQSGRPTGGLVVMSGYRTPWYNHAIGNVPYSRHAWGGAADVYVDQAPVDGRMDDLNGDGRSDRNDARWLAALVNGMADRGEFGQRIGGLGIYGSTTAHGPFVHVDARGFRARW